MAVVKIALYILLCKIFPIGTYVETCFRPWPCMPVGFHTDSPAVYGQSGFTVVLGESE